MTKDQEIVIRQIIRKISDLHRKHLDVSLPTGQHGDRRERCDPDDPEQIALIRNGKLCLCGASDYNVVIADVVSVLKVLVDE